ncbi:inducible T-cell costimulator-like [Pipra filicauda]|uniref:Inducible T-cell costimulator n=1 Tax=Pipra filicauda TaxID=649802 RepID=A0A6J2HJB3_9PASS|nr:inducible T-cell costimulator-like [Pipra filicauda]
MVPLCQAGMKSVAVTFCVLCFHFEALYRVESCSSNPCKNIDQLYNLDPQVMVEFENGNFNFTFPNPQNVSEFSMTLFKGKEKKEICTLHLNEENVFPKSNVTYCETKNSNTSTTFILKNLERKHMDIYIYCLEVFFPPPYIDCRLKEICLYIPDKEDCFSLGQESWVIIALIMVSLISCACCVVVCCLRNKIQKCDSNSHEYNSEYMPMAAVNAAKKPRI